jgi:hypothetical protein
MLIFFEKEKSENTQNTSEVDQNMGYLDDIKIDKDSESFFFSALGTETKASCMLGKHVTMSYIPSLKIHNLFL